MRKQVLMLIAFLLIDNSFPFDISFFLTFQFRQVNVDVGSFIFTLLLLIRKLL